MPGLYDYLGMPGRDNPYGANLPNSALPNPTYLGDGNTNFFINNKNFEGDLVAEIWTNLNLEMIRQTDFMHLKFATGVLTAPRNAGSAKLVYNRPRPLSVVINPLREGELPTKLVGGSEKGTYSYDHFGAYMQTTDIEMEQNRNTMFVRYGADLIRSANESFDIITREFMYRAASYAYANGATSIDELADKGVYFNAPGAGVNTWKAKAQRGGQLTFNDIREVIKNMKLLKVKPHPTYGKFIVLIGVDGIDQLRNDGEFKSWNYATDPSMFNNYDHVLVSTDVAIYEIENAKIAKSAAGNQAGVAFVIGNDAYKEVRLEGGDLKIIVKPLGSAGSSDPLDQTATMAWKKAFGLVCIRSEALVALHYSLENQDAINLYGVTIDWTEDGGTFKRTKMTNRYSGYTFTRLQDGANDFLLVSDLTADNYENEDHKTSGANTKMSNIHDITKVNPQPYPTDQNTYVEKQADSNSKATVDYINPGLQKVIGSLMTQLDPKIIAKITSGEINVVNAINNATAVSTQEVTVEENAVESQVEEKKVTAKNNNKK